MRITRTLDRFIFAELEGPFIFGVVAFTVLLVAGDVLFQIADMIVSQKVGLVTVGKLFIYRLPGVVVLTFPMATLTASLLAFGKMSSSGEILALRASGISFFRLLRPVIIGSFLISLFSFLLNEALVPISNRAAKNIMILEAAHKGPIISMKEHVFYREIKDGQLQNVIYVAKLDYENGLMENILVQQFDNGRLDRIMVAEKGSWKEGVWTLINGQTYRLKEDGSVTDILKFEQQEMPFKVSPKQVQEEAIDQMELTVWELKQYINLLELQGIDVTKLKVRMHMRWAVPWACIVLAMMGAPLGVTPHRGGAGMGLGMSVLIVFAYYVVMSLCKALGDASYLAPVAAAWIPNGFFIGIGIALAYRKDHS